MRVDVHELEQYIRWIHGRWTWFEEQFGDTPTITVWYEEFCRETAKFSRRVQHFLGARIVDGLQPETVKVGRAIQELVTNYDALRRHFDGSPYESFFAPAAEGVPAMAA